MSTSQNIVNAKIKFRTDTLERWNAINPLISENELIFVTDIDSIDPNIYGIKRSDGLKTFKDLPYLHLNEIYSKKLKTASLEAGVSTSAEGDAAVALGYRSLAKGNFSTSLGSFTYAKDNNSFVWNGNTNEYNFGHHLSSMGTGTFVINPVNNISGFYIGSDSLYDHIKNIAPTELDYTQSALCSIELISTETQTSTVSFDQKCRLCLRGIELTESGNVSLLQIAGMPAGVNLPDFASIDVLSGDRLVVTGIGAKVSYVIIPYVTKEVE